MTEPNPKPAPSYAPVYAASLYPDLAVTARQHGYALAVHGSLQKDMDLIAIPWVDNPRPPEELIEAITREFAIRVIGEPGQKPHGRIAHTIIIGHGSYIDLSFMPAQTQDAGRRSQEQRTENDG